MNFAMSDCAASRALAIVALASAAQLTTISSIQARAKTDRGWTSGCCIVAEVATRAPQSPSPEATSISYPVVFVKAADLRRLGIALGDYGTDASSTRPDPNQYPNRCYYYGDGGYDMSISNEFIARFKARGFSRRSLCMALVSEARFDPETGRRLATYIVANPANLARNRGIAEPGDLTNELPLVVPDCFKGGLPYSDCRMNFDLKTGQRFSAERTNAFKATGNQIEAKLRDPATRGSFRYLEESRYTRGKIMVGGNRHTGISNASFYDYSSEFPKGFGYALNADGAAAPDPSAEAVRLALDSRRQANEATLRALETDLKK